MSTAMQQTNIHKGMRHVASLKDCPKEREIAEAIFMRADWVILPGDDRVEMTRYSGGTVFAVEHRGLKYVEQNKRKTSPSGQRAFAGAQIIWIIKNGVYIGKIEDGEVYHR